jgi:DNA polymerase-3 subunit epsilon
MIKHHPADAGLIWVDTETGSLDTGQAALLELAFILTDASGGRIEDVWSGRLLPVPGDLMEPGALAINGYDPDEWARTAVDPYTAYQQLQWAARGAIFASHNVPFDRAMIMRFLGRFGVRRWPGDHHTVDTVALAWPLLAARAVPDLKLATLTTFFGIRHERAHTALADCDAARQVYMALMARFDIYGLVKKQEIAEIDRLFGEE